MTKELTAEEVSNLWSSYLTNTMSVYVSRYFVKSSQDEQVQKMLEYAEAMAAEEVEKSSQFFNEAGYPLPQGFSEQDVDMDCPPLYTDNSMLVTKYMLSKDALVVYALSLSSSTRPDIRQFYENCLLNTARLNNICADIVIKKGLHNPLFHIPEPERIEKVDKQSFLSGWFTDRRPINALEINQLTYNFKSMETQKELLRSFAQTTKTKELKEHFQRGVDIINKQQDILQGILSENGLPKLPTWESEVTDSTEAPFSDRLMLFKMSALTSTNAARYGTSLSTAMRRDLAAHYTGMMTGHLKYGEDTANLMIKYGFLDQMPMAGAKHLSPSSV